MSLTFVYGDPVADASNGRLCGQTDSGQNRLSPGESRSQDRSRTYVGIAEAIADQWG